MNHRFACLAATAALVATTLVAPDADACGGCFIAPTENTVVTGHRMAVSISPDQSILWDQIQYSGNAADFSWVLPVKQGAVVEVASDAFFDVLEAATQVTVTAPPEGCAVNNGGGSGFGCGDSESFAGLDARGESNTGGVQVIHEGTVGPYETVTLRATEPNALRNWLDTNGYALPDDVAPIVDAYVEEEFDFIALKLAPNQGVQQMQPVRVVTPGSSVALPLRMVAAGAGATVDLVLYVIGEGRYEPRDYANVSIDAGLVTWDFRSDTTDYAEQRLQALQGNDGRTWLTAYSRTGTMLSQGGVSLQVGNGFANSIGEGYFLQGESLGEVSSSDLMTCLQKLQGIQGSMDVVVDTCDPETETCGTAGAGEIDARDLACGDLDDLARAMVGLHPADVTLTRLEGALPREALDGDLILEAGSNQNQVSNTMTAGLKANACWDSEPAAAPTFLNPGRGPKLPPGAALAMVLGAAGVVLVGRRRMRTA